MLGLIIAIVIFPGINTIAAKSTYGKNYVDEKGVTHINNVKTTKKNALPIIKRKTAPSNVAWSNEANEHGWVTFTSYDQEAIYVGWLEKNGEVDTSFDFGTIGAGEQRIDLSTHINESGTYRFRIKACDNDQDTSSLTGAVSQYTADYVYTKPNQSMPIPTGLAWSTSRAGIATWNAVPNAKGYEITLYKNDQEVVTISADYSEGTEEDFSGQLGDTSDRNYYLKVRALSRDIEAIANGDFSDYSAGLDGSTIDTSNHNDNNNNNNTNTEVTAESTRNLVSTAKTAQEAEKALDSYIEKIDTNNLAVAMQTSQEQKQKIVELEEEYKQKANVTVTNSITAPGIDSSKVKIVGAGLNAGANSAVSFNISKTDESAKKAINTNLYRNVVQFDMDLSNASKVSSDGKLAIPVEITMPLPEGFKLDMTLKILHFHRSDDGYDIIIPRINSDGTISFTITHFSTFAFIDELSVNDEVKDSDGNTYKVIASGVVEFKAPKNKKIKKLTIPATITVGNTKCKVTSIANKALKGCTKLESVTIGKNMTTIGKNAFDGDKKLKTITFKSKTIKSIGKNAFKGINSKATFKLSGTKKQKNALAKKIKKSATGYKKTMNIKK